MKKEVIYISAAPCKKIYMHFHLNVLQTLYRGGLTDHYTVMEFICIRIRLSVYTFTTLCAVV